MEHLYNVTRYINNSTLKAILLQILMASGEMFFSYKILNLGAPL